MKRSMTIAVVSLVSTTAHADDSLAAAETRIARDAAAHRHCDVVGAIAKQVAENDPAYYATTFLDDPTIAACMTSGQPQPTVAATPVALSSTPPLDADRISHEVITGIGAGLGGAGAGALAGVYFATSGFCDLRCAGKLIGGGAAVGYPFGVAVGVFAVGRSDYQNGSFGAAMGGAAIGMAGAIGIALWTDNPGARVAALVGLPVASSTILFNVTRRYDMKVVPLPTRNGVGLAGTF